MKSHKKDIERIEKAVELIFTAASLLDDVRHANTGTYFPLKSSIDRVEKELHWLIANKDGLEAILAYLKEEG